MAKQFPKEMFVKIDADPTDKSLQWFLADDEMHGLVNMGGKEKIAVYKLVELREITGVVQHKKLPAPRARA